MILLIPLLYILSVFFVDDITVYIKHDSIDGTMQIVNTKLAKGAFWLYLINNLLL